MSLPTSNVTFLLDKSVSMLGIKGATIEGFNAYLTTLQEEPDAEILFTFLQFDTISLDKICVATPVKDVPMLNDATYQPKGGTPLIDASYKTILAVEIALAKAGGIQRVVICIQTDGEENSSVEYNWEQLKTKIAEKQAEGWEFNFLGAGIDAYRQGARMGISTANTMSYDAMDAGRTQEAFHASASNARDFSATRSASTSYTLSQKAASGDAYDPAVNAVPIGLSRQAVAMPDLSSATSGPLDLSTPQPPATAGQRVIASVQAARADLAKKQAVPDITL